MAGRLPDRLEIQITPGTTKFLYCLTVKTGAKIGVKARRTRKMQIRYAEDYKAGDVYELGSYEVKQEEIIKFSQKL